MRLTLLPDGISAEVERGACGVDILDEHPEIAVPVSCRSAHCGTCLVRVAAGAAKLEPASEWELETVGQLGNDPGLRLACSIVISGDTGEIILERVAPVMR